MCAMKHFRLTSGTVFLCSLLAVTAGSVNGQCLIASANTAGTNGNSTGVGTLAWTNTGATTAADANYATAAALVSTGLLPVTTTTNYLALRNFGFNIPAGYTICGVGVSITRGYAALLQLNGGVVDNVVQ